jgi:hypothetical protein
VGGQHTQCCNFSSSSWLGSPYKRGNAAAGEGFPKLIIEASGNGTDGEYLGGKEGSSPPLLPSEIVATYWEEVMRSANDPGL